MLPSLRLITATFCCGFLMVFAGLRLATSVDNVHQAIPLMAAHAAPVRIAPIGDSAQRRQVPAMPVTYDMRFAVSAPQHGPIPIPVAASPDVERATPLVMPLMTLPPMAQEAAPAEATENPESTVIAALPAEPAAERKPAAVDIPLPEPATVDLTFSSPPSGTQKPAAAEATAALPAQPSPSIDVPLPEPATVDLTFSPSPATIPDAAKPEPGTGPRTESAPETDARAASARARDSDVITVAALPDDVPAGTVVLPVRRIPLPKSRAADEPIAARHPAVMHRAARTAAAKAKPRRKATANRDDFDNFFNVPGSTQQ